MATTSIWRVNGWLGKVLIYIENPDKTENPAVFEKQDMDGKGGPGPIRCDRVRRPAAKNRQGGGKPEGETVMQQFVSGVNCSPLLPAMR